MGHASDRAGPDLVVSREGVKGRAIFLETGTVITPFGDPAPAAYYSGQTVAEAQEDACRRNGLEVIRVRDPEAAIRAQKEAPAGPVVLVLDRVFFTEKALGDFLKATKSRPGPSALALTLNASVDYTLPLQDIRRDGARVIHDLLRVDQAPLPPPGPDPVAWLRQIAADPVEVEKREIVTEVPLPTIGEGPKNVLRYPVTSTVVVSIESWIHVLWLNQLSFGIRWIELLRRKPLWALWRAATALSLNRHRLLDRLVWRGRGSQIHPTAYVSASILGSNVKIGAHATVRNSILGDEVIIEDHAVVQTSVIGHRNLVPVNTVLVSCATYPDATVGNLKLQVSLVGRGAYLNLWANFVDAKFVGHVKTEHRGQLASTERSFIGSVIGHRAKMAAKVLIQPGRQIPNDTVVVMRPDEVVSHVPADLPAGVPLVRDHGTLVPLGEETQR